MHEVILKILTVYNVCLILLPPVMIRRMDNSPVSMCFVITMLIASTMLISGR